MENSSSYGLLVAPTGCHFIKMHIGLKRKIQRLLKVNFVNRNFIRQDLQKVRQSRATNRVSGAATIKSFQFPSMLATPSHPKSSKEHPNWKFWACVHGREWADFYSRKHIGWTHAQCQNLTFYVKI